MSDVENPYAKYGQQPIAVDELNPYAKYSQPSEVQPTVVEDVLNSAAPSLARGAIGLVTTPGTIADLTDKGTEWALKKIAPEASAKLEEKRKEQASQPQSFLNSVHDVTGAWKNLLPTYDTALKTVEKTTGPLPEAKTPIGKGVQAGLEVLPSVVGGGAIPGALKAIGAGTLSGSLGELANKFSDVLPKWAEPVARGVGSILGTGLPATARRMVTPLPASTEQAATVAALKAKDPKFPLSAGQETGREWLLNAEGQSGKFTNLPAKQNEAFTRGVMRDMGVDGLATPENIRKGDDIGKAIGNITVSNKIDPVAFAQLKRDVNDAKTTFERSAGRHNAGALKEIQDEIRLGASGNSTVSNMTGGRYQYLREDLQSKIDGAANAGEKRAISKIRDSLDKAFATSLGPDEAKRLKDLQTQYANYKTISEHSNPSLEGVLTPKDARAAVKAARGNSAITEDKGSIAPWARNVGRVAKEMPEAPAKPGSSGLGVLLGGPFGAAAGYATGGASHAVSEGLVGAITGGHLGDIVHALKQGGSKVMSAAPVQEYLKNQKWLPGQNTSGLDKAALIRVLMNNPQAGLPAVSQ